MSSPGAGLGGFAPSSWKPQLQVNVFLGLDLAAFAPNPRTHAADISGNILPGTFDEKCQKVLTN